MCVVCGGCCVFVYTSCGVTVNLVNRVGPRIEAVHVHNDRI